MMSRDDALLSLMRKTGYPMDQKNGQRIFGPPPDWNGPAPERGSEIFVGKIPRDCYEDVLVPAFEKCGRIYLLRLMMDFSGSNRGYCFVMFTNRTDARMAVHKMNNYEIQHGRFLGVCMSLDNCQLFYGNIPPNIKESDFMREISALTEDVVSVNIRPQERYAYVEYKSHRAAAMARRKLIPGKHTIQNYPLTVDWAEPKADTSDEKSIFIQGIPMGVSEDQIKNVFNQNLGGTYVDHVKKMKDSALVHFIAQNFKDRGLSLWRTNAQSLFHNYAQTSKSIQNQAVDMNFINSFNQLSVVNRLASQQQQYNIMPPQMYLPMPPQFIQPNAYAQQAFQSNQSSFAQNGQAILQPNFPHLKLPTIESSTQSYYEKLNALCLRYGLQISCDVYPFNTVGEAGDVSMYRANIRVGDRSVMGQPALTHELAKENAAFQMMIGIKM